MSFKEIFLYIGQPVIIVGAITWIIQALGKFYLDKRMKVYEKELDIQKSLLEKEINLILTKSSTLYQDQLSIIRELYKKLAVLNREMTILITQVKFIAKDFDEEMLTTNWLIFILKTKFYSQRK